jgi:hypothetical protein
MSGAMSFALRPDRKGMTWDLLLYVPTVVALASMAFKFWYGGDQSLAYLLSFLACFFLIAGANRVLKTRLMLLPSAPVGLEIADDVIRVILRGGQATDLVKEQRFYTDYAGRTFGVSGLDRGGRRQQVVLHKGQFADEKQFGAAQDALRRATRATAGPAKR